MILPKINGWDDPIAAEKVGAVLNFDEFIENFTNIYVA